MSNHYAVHWNEHTIADWLQLKLKKKSLNFSLLVMAVTKRFSISEDHNEIFLQKLFFGSNMAGTWDRISES